VVEKGGKINAPSPNGERHNRPSPNGDNEDVRHSFSSLFGRVFLSFPSLAKRGQERFY
jgi:hypothetical protein